MSGEFTTVATSSNCYENTGIKHMILCWCCVLRVYFIFKSIFNTQHLTIIQKDHLHWKWFVYGWHLLRWLSLVHLLWYEKNHIHLIHMFGPAKWTDWSYGSTALWALSLNSSIESTTTIQYLFQNLVRNSMSAINQPYVHLKVRTITKLCLPYLLNTQSTKSTSNLTVTSFGTIWFRFQWVHWLAFCLINHEEYEHWSNNAVDAEDHHAPVKSNTFQ